MIQLEENFDGHIILFLKNHYKVKDIDLFTGLRRIWATRCAIPFEFADKSMDTYIANRLYKILERISPNKIKYLHEIVHDELGKDYLNTYKNLSHIETLIKVYSSEIAWSTVNEGGKKLYKLPKPQKRVFNGILKAEEKYNNYKLVK